MLDIHCHILPGVDDGAQSMDESLAMFEAARKAGVSSIIATPHVRDPYYNQDGLDRIVQAFERFKQAVAPFPVRLGFEVNHRKLEELGVQNALRYRVEGSHVILLELSVGASPSRFADYQRTIFELQGMGLDVIIAHPERYLAIQNDISIAEDLVRMGCRLQASADFMEGGRFGRERRPAHKMLKRGLYSYIASDAHYPGHYKLLEIAMDKYSKHLAR